MTEKKDRYTAQEYREMLLGKKKIPILLADEKNNTQKTPQSESYNRKIIQSILNSQFYYGVSNDHIALFFDGARLLSVNQIFSSFQTKKRRFELFNYKKVWNNHIQGCLAQIAEKNTLPYFDNQVELTIFRQALNLVDNDALPTMFKFIIDSLKSEDHKHFSVIPEDNPMVVSKITQINQKGGYAVGIRIDKISTKENTPRSVSFLDLL